MRCDLQIPRASCDRATPLHHAAGAGPPAAAGADPWALAPGTQLVAGRGAGWGNASFGTKPPYRRTPVPPNITTAEHPYRRTSVPPNINTIQKTSVPLSAVPPSTVPPHIRGQHSRPVPPQITTARPLTRAPPHRPRQPTPWLLPVPPECILQDGRVADSAYTTHSHENHHDNLRTTQTVPVVLRVVPHTPCRFQKAALRVVFRNQRTCSSSPTWL